MSRKRQFGSVRRVTSGRWQARVQDPATLQRVPIGTFRAKADADRAVALAAADQTRGAWVDPGRGRITLEEYAHRWLEDRPLRPRTWELYESLLRLHILSHLGRAELGQLAPATSAPGTPPG